MSDPTPDGTTPPAPYGSPAPQQPAYGQQPPAYGQQPPAYGQPPAYPGQQQAPYGAAAYGAAPAYGGYPAPKKTNTLAVVSLISSLVGVFVIPLIGQIVGVITGHMSLNQIKTTGEGGRGMALAGTIIGWVSLGLVILTLILIFAVFVPFAMTNGVRYSS